MELITNYEQSIDTIVFVFESINIIKTFEGSINFQVAESIIAMLPECEKNNTLTNEKLNEIVQMLHCELVNIHAKYVNVGENKIVLSFAIPTNKTTLARKAASRILEYDGDDIEVVISHNYLEEATEESGFYIDDKRFKFYKKEYVDGDSLDPQYTYGYNFMNALAVSTGDYVYFLADKDSIKIKSIPFIISVIHRCKNTSLLYFRRDDKVNEECLPTFIGYPKGDIALNAIYVNFVLT